MPPNLKLLNLSEYLRNVGLKLLEKCWPRPLLLRTGNQKPLEATAAVVELEFRGRQAPPNQDEARVVGFRPGEKFNGLLRTEFLRIKIGLNLDAFLW